MVITPHFQCGDECSIHSTRTKWNNRRRISAVERNLGSHKIATFTGSWNAPRYSVQIPALMCTSTGYGEQTISKNRRNVSFLFGKEIPISLLSKTHLTMDRGKKCLPKRLSIRSKGAKVQGHRRIELTFSRSKIRRVANRKPGNLLTGNLKVGKFGLACTKALARNTCNVFEMGSIPIRSTNLNWRTFEKNWRLG